MVRYHRQRGVRMQFTLTTYRRAAQQWRGLSLIGFSLTLFVMIVAFGEALGLPLVLRVLLSAVTGIGLTAGRLMRTPHA